MKETSTKPYDWVKIHFWSETDYPELMWAVPDIDNRNFILDNVPFYTYDVSFWDTIDASVSNDWTLEFTKLIKRSGHSTIRISWQIEDQLTPNELLKELWLKASAIETTGKLYALDIHPEEQKMLDSILSLLQQKENEWELVYEEWHLFEKSK